MFLDNYLLSSIILIPLLGAIIVLFIDNSDVVKIKNVALTSSMFTFFLSTFLWVFFDRSTSKFQFMEEFLWKIP